MSFYGMIFGKNEHADALLNLLNLKKEDFYRFRDCYLGEDEYDDNKPVIAVYTRGGGDNRECSDYGDCERRDENGDLIHEDNCVVTIQNKIRQHPLFKRDEDDDFDNTYATFYFKVPDAQELESLGIAKEPNRNEMWLAFLEAIKE